MENKTGLKYMQLVIIFFLTFDTFDVILSYIKHGQGGLVYKNVVHIITKLYINEKNIFSII